MTKSVTVTFLFRLEGLKLNDTDWINDFKEKRTQYGVSQNRLAVMAGVSREYVSRIESGKVALTEEMVLELEGTPVGNEMKAIQQKWFSSFDEFIDHKDEIRYYDVGDGAALAEYLICEENVFGEIPHELQKHIDYKRR